MRHINGIAADKNHCLWFTTQTGIYRFDGSKFKHFSVANTPVLQFERMTGISTVSGKNETRWVIKDSKGGLYEIDDKSRIRQFVKNEGDEYLHNKFGNPLLDQNIPVSDQLPAKAVIESFIFSATGKAFFQTQDAMLVRCNIADIGKTHTLDTLFRFPSKSTLESRDRLFHFASGVYLISDKRMMCWTGNEKATDVILTGDILNESGGIPNFTELTASITADPRFVIFVFKNQLYEVREIKHGILYTRLLANYKGTEKPSTFYYSPEQQLFICYSFSRGLSFYRPRQFRLLNLPDEAQEKKEDYYYSLIPSDKGFISISNKGLVELPLTGAAKLIYGGPVEKFFLYKDDKGDYWFNERGLHFRYNRASGKVSLLSDIHGVFTGVIEKRSIYYILTENRLLECRMIDNRLEMVRELYKSDSTIQQNFLFEVNDNTFWIGSDRGLVEYDVKKNTTRVVEELRNTYLRAACKLSDNNFLLGSYDKGIYQYYNGKWSHLTSATRQLPSSVHGFIIDKGTASLWTSSNTGIYRIPLNELQNPDVSKSSISVRHFTQFGSDIPAEFNGSSNISAALLSDTTLAFANANGIVIFNPKQLLLSPLPVNVLVESVNENDSLPSEVGTSQHIEFNPVVPYYGNLQELDVQYMLTNSDKDWHPLLPNTIISYNNLRPGDHDLKFRIRYHHAVTQQEIALTAATFHVAYKWYQTIWFKILAAILIACIIIGFHNFRIWYLKKREKELEKMVSNKTQELKETNSNLVEVIDELNRSENSLKQSNFLKDEYYAVLTHDLRSPLKFLAFNLGQMLERFPTIGQQELKQGLTVSNQTAHDIHKLIDEFVYWIQDNEKQLEARPSPTLISATVADVSKIYQYALQANHNRFDVNIEHGLTFVTDPKLLFIILRNAVDNANKYCRHGIITVTAKKTNDQLEIAVTDTGRGISEDMVQHLTSLQHENVQLGYKERKSLGFYIMAKLTKKLEGNYTIQSEKDKGTGLKFSFPELNLKHENPDR